MRGILLHGEGHNRIQEVMREERFGHSVKMLHVSRPVQEREFIGVVSKGRIGSTDMIDRNQVKGFLLKLLFPIFDVMISFRCKANQNLIRSLL